MRLTKLNGLKENTILRKLLQKRAKCALKLCLEATKVLLVCAFLISRTRLFFNVTAIINLEQFSILSAFSKILKTTRLDFLKALTIHA